jgi:integrase
MGSLAKDSRGRSKNWIACYRASNGQRLKKSTKTADLKRAKEMLAAWEHAENLARRGEATKERLLEVMNETLRRVESDPITSPSVQKYLADWLKDINGTVKQGTYREYERIIEEFLEFLGPRQAAKLETVAAQDVIRFRDSMRQDGRAVGTINRIIGKGGLGAPFEHARKIGTLRTNPFDAVKKLKGDSAAKGTFTFEQIVRLLRTATHDWKGMVFMAYGTGARLSDIANLRWSDLDMETSFVHFRTKKTSKLSEIALHPDFLDWLSQVSPPEDPRAALFPSLSGLPTSGQKGLSTQFSELMAAAGVESEVLRQGSGRGKSVRSLSFHSFRHGAVSAIFNSKIIEEAQKRVSGHASTAVLRGYTHAERQAIQAAVNSIPRLPKTEGN